jgi:hypothetical protein
MSSFSRGVHTGKKLPFAAGRSARWSPHDASGPARGPDSEKIHTTAHPVAAPPPEEAPRLSSDNIRVSSDNICLYRAPGT